MDKILYHYCSTQKMYGIMSGRQLRMSDITKSNDYDEVYMFFPGIIYAMRDVYYKNSFPFERVYSTTFFILIHSFIIYYSESIPLLL